MAQRKQSTPPAKSAKSVKPSKPAAKAANKPVGKTASKPAAKRAVKPAAKPAAKLTKPAKPIKLDPQPNVVVQESPIHGKGIFASRRIPNGDTVGVFQGKDTMRNGMHVLWVTDDDGAETGLNVKNELRYINHSKKPNAEADGHNLIAIRSIPKGTEITIHYGDDWEDDN